MKAAPAFQFYPGDFLQDMNVSLMTLEEKGAYITLLSYAWLEGSIPADHEKLARLCSCSTEDIGRIWPALEPCFRPKRRSNGALLINKRLETERIKQRKYRERQQKLALDRHAKGDGK